MISPLIEMTNCCSDTTRSLVAAVVLTNLFCFIWHPGGNCFTEASINHFLFSSRLIFHFNNIPVSLSLLAHTTILILCSSTAFSFQFLSFNSGGRIKAVTEKLKMVVFVFSHSAPPLTLSINPKITFQSPKNPYRF